MAEIQYNIPLRSYPTDYILLSCHQKLSYAVPGIHRNQGGAYHELGMCLVNAAIVRPCRFRFPITRRNRALANFLPNIRRQRSGFKSDSTTLVYSKPTISCLKIP